MTKITVPWKTYFYYRRKLSRDEQKIYYAILLGLLNWEKKISLPIGGDFDRIYEIYLMVLQDCPILFHVSDQLTGATVFRPHIIPTYTMSETVYLAQYTEVKRFLDNCSKQLSTRSAFDSCRILHDAIRKHVIYHDTSTSNEHNILGTIVDRKAVCESIAKAYKLMCDVNMIPCIVVFGRSTESNPYIRNDDDNVGEDNHAWNMVKLDGKWYWVDVTFDLSPPRNDNSLAFYYDYFLCSDARFSRRHRASKNAPLPACPEDFNLHRRMDKYADSEADIINITRAAIINRSLEVVFEISSAFIVDEDQVLKAIHKGTRFTPYTTITYSYNEAMRIFHAELS